MKKEILLLFAASALLLSHPGFGARLRHGPAGLLHAQVTPPKEGSSQGGLARAAGERKLELLKAIARSLRDEAYSVQQQGRLQDAIVRYRESLVYYPDEGLNAYISALETRTGKTSPSAGPQNPPLQSSVSVNVRNRSRQSVHVLPEGQTANASHFLATGDIKSISATSDPQGRITFVAVRDGKVIASSVWHGDLGNAGKVPVLLFDDTDGPPKLIAMTGVRLR